MYENIPLFLTVRTKEQFLGYGNVVADRGVLKRFKKIFVKKISRKLEFELLCMSEWPIEKLTSREIIAC